MIRENYAPCAHTVMIWQYRHKIKTVIIFKDDPV